MPTEPSAPLDLAIRALAHEMRVVMIHAMIDMDTDDKGRRLARVDLDTLPTHLATLTLNRPDPTSETQEMANV